MCLSDRDQRELAELYLRRSRGDVLITYRVRSQWGRPFQVDRNTEMLCAPQTCQCVLQSILNNLTNIRELRIFIGRQSSLEMLPLPQGVPFRWKS